MSDPAYYYNRFGRWVKPVPREPFVLFFGLPLVDRWWNEKYATMYRARYGLGGNINRIAEEDTVRFSHADLNLMMEDVLKDREEKCEVGGEMQIAALAAARVMDKSDTVATVGAVGDDYAKRVCLKAMQEGGVTPLYKVILRGEGTGFRVIYDDFDYDTKTVECCRYTFPRAGAEIKADDLKEAKTEAAIAKTSWLYVDGWSLRASAAATTTLANRVARDEQRILVNIAYKDALETSIFPLNELFKLADVVVMSQALAEEIHRAREGGDSEEDSDGNVKPPVKIDWKEGARAIAEKMPPGGGDMSQLRPPPPCVRWVVVTRGKEDIAIVEGHPLNTSDTKFSYVKATPEPETELSQWMPKDRRGVGDLFAGGLVAALAKGQKIEDAVATGHKLAAYSLTQVGPKLPPKSG